MGERTTVNVDKETWRELHLRKGPGDSMDDVIRDLLEKSEKFEELEEDENTE